jgi:hypothetical protein
MEGQAPDKPGPTTRVRVPPPERKRIYFSKRIGQLLCGLSFSAVSKVYQRMTKAIKENRAMRKKIDKIASILAKFNGCYYTTVSMTISDGRVTLHTAHCEIGSRRWQRKRTHQELRTIANTTGGA